MNTLWDFFVYKNIVEVYFFSSSFRIRGITTEDNISALRALKKTSPRDNISALRALKKLVREIARSKMVRG